MPLFNTTMSLTVYLDATSLDRCLHSCTMHSNYYYNAHFILYFHHNVMSVCMLVLYYSKLYMYMNSNWSLCTIFVVVEFVIQFPL